MIVRVAYFVVIYLLTTSKAANGVIGLNWGRQSVQRLIPSMVVDLMLQNGVKHARIYTTHSDILKAFSGSGINLNIGIFNLFTIDSEDKASAWVQTKIQYFGPANIRRIYIGNYAFKYGMKNQTFREGAIKTLKFVQNALNKAGYGDLIKVTVPQAATALKRNITRPSEAEFRDELMDDINSVLRVLVDNDAPFAVEIFPALYVDENGMDPDFAFVDNSSAHVVTDVGGAVYTNVFDFVYDSFAWALEKAGAGHLELIVDTIGWPTDGYPGGNTSSAERFFRSFLPKVASNKGTPKRPGRPIETYVHSLTDETQMPDNEPCGRHWGIYRSNGEPKYKIDLTGQGRDIFPARAKGIMRMPNRWCMFNGKTADEEKVDRQATQACMNADCTSLTEGGSCSHLNLTQTVSYKFNVYFQSMFQDENACKFEGLGEVVTEDPSSGECVFPVEVVRGHQEDFTKSAATHGKRMHPMTVCAVLVACLSILWALLST